MTNEELCLRYQAGDAGAAEELISRNMGLIRSIATSYAHDYQNARMDADDYTQEGAVALLRAASHYDPSCEVQFLTYAGRAVRNAIIDAIRADNPNLVLTPLDEAHTGSADDNDDTDLFIGRMKTRLPSSYEADPETIYIRKEQLEELYAAISSLSPRHHAWIICRYGFNDDVYKSLAEMSRIYHLSEIRAKRTEDEAIGKLKKELKRSL
ncbi:MAG: sigma-70 family RNA polymerase sigma factor, partial [Oscillospiraceae bacterium]|nr:sigma-70 family RNA polymerase sigma factor [Oscillospiraceae bacterium]